jgi:hypothetical protein
MPHIVYKVEIERATDRRGIAGAVGVAGLLAYGATEKEAVASAQALALRPCGSLRATERTGRDGNRFI